MGIGRRRPLGDNKSRPTPQINYVKLKPYSNKRSLAVRLLCWKINLILQSSGSGDRRSGPGPYSGVLLTTAPTACGQRSIATACACTFAGSDSVNDHAPHRWDAERFRATGDTWNGDWFDDVDFAASEIIRMKRGLWTASAQNNFLSE